MVSRIHGCLLQFDIAVFFCYKETGCTNAKRLINSSDKCQIRDRRRTWLGYGLYTGHIEWVFDMHYIYGYT